MSARRSSTQLIILAVALATLGACTGRPGSDPNSAVPGSSPGGLSPEKRQVYAQTRAKVDAIKAKGVADAKAAIDRGDKAAAKVILDQAAQEIAAAIRESGLSDAEAAEAKASWVPEAVTTTVTEATAATATTAP